MNTSRARRLPEKAARMKEEQVATARAMPFERPERRLTILLLATAVAFGFLGTLIGSFVLASLAGLPTDLGLSLFPSHPDLQIFGFVGEFVMGVAYSLLPRFKASRLPWISLGYLVYGMMTCANLLLLLSSIVRIEPGVLIVAPILMLAGSVVFLYQVASIARLSTGGFPEVNPFFVLSALSLVLISALLLLELDGVAGPTGDVFTPQMVLLALVGFAGSEIYAVQVRSVSFRQCDYRKRMTRVASILQVLAVAAVFVAGVFPERVLSLIGGVFLLAAAVGLLLSIKILEIAHPLMLRPAMTRMHYRIMRYNEVCILSAALWLVVGIALGTAWLGFGVDSFFVRDTFIHSLAIGFIGSNITCFAPMLLPGLLGRKGPVTGLSFGPIATLNLGIAVRVAGNLQSLGGQGLPSWESLSGPFVVASMVWFLIMLKGVGVRRPAAGQAIGAPERPSKRIDDLVDFKLTVLGAPGGERSFPVWFVQKGGALYALPLQGKDTPWYREVLAHPEVRVSLPDRVLTGTATPVTGREVMRIVKEFKNKYGERNFENYVGRRASVGVRIVLQDQRQGPS